MMIDSESEMITPKEIEKRRRALKVRIYDWRKKGYNVSRFTDLIDKDITVAEEALQEFLSNVDQLKRFEEGFYRMDTTGFEEKVIEIEKMLKDPDRIDELETALVSLEEEILIKNNEEAGIGKTLLPEVNLKRELDRIREEELKKVRQEEGERIRQEERKRILNEELERIRKEEKEKIRKTELERIRREEKEQLIWEDRVMQQLKDSRMKPKGKTGQKKKKCPSCGGMMVIPTSKRPLKIKCPACGKDYTLKAKGDVLEKEAKGPKVQYKKCPKCGSPIPIISDKRPLRIICQMCNSEYLLKGKRGGTVRKQMTKKLTVSNRSQPFSLTRSSVLKTNNYGATEVSSDEKFMNCPTCRREIPMSAKVCGYCGSPIEKKEIEMKKNIFCPHCGKEIPDDVKICGYCGNHVKKESAVAPLDNFELPLSPSERIQNTYAPEDKKQFKPLNDLRLPGEPGSSPPNPFPKPDEIKKERFRGPSDVVTCTKCGNLVPRGAKFCGVCGNHM